MFFNDFSRFRRTFKGDCDTFCGFATELLKFTDFEDRFVQISIRCLTIHESTQSQQSVDVIVFFVNSFKLVESNTIQELFVGKKWEITWAVFTKELASFLTVRKIFSCFFKAKMLSKIFKETRKIIWDSDTIEILLFLMFRYYRDYYSWISEYYCEFCGEFSQQSKVTCF